MFDEPEVITDEELTFLTLQGKIEDLDQVVYSVGSGKYYVQDLVIAGFNPEGRKLSYRFDSDDVTMASVSTSVTGLMIIVRHKKSRDVVAALRLDWPLHKIMRKININKFVGLFGKF